MNQKLFRVYATWACGGLLVLAAACSATTETGSTATGDAASGLDLLFGELAVDSATTDSTLPLPDSTAQTSDGSDAWLGDGPQGTDATGDGPGADATCGETGCACSANGQCDSGYCIETPGGQQCTSLCSGSCSEGFKCGQISGSGADIISLCVPLHPRLCEPCAADSDCSNVLGGAESRCIPYQDAKGAVLGAFCGNACADSADCPSGYSCSESTSVGGATGKQCTKTDLACACDGRAIKLQLSTACSVANGAGSCGGKRTCSSSGLTVCDAASAASETCNLKDDDCDGQTDEPGGLMCDDGAQCTYDNCVAGACQHPPMTGACDDASACSTGDKCSDGACVGVAVVCDDKNPCTQDACNPSLGCTSTPADGGLCSDGSVCTVGDVCQGGACLPGATTACDDDNLCTTDSCNALTGCIAASNSLPCSDGDACTLGDGCKNGACANTGKLPCNDGNPCTDDSCDPVQGCLFATNSLICSDNNVCTTGDVCAQGVCAPTGTLACDDGNGCTTESCDPKGGCKSTNNAAPCTDDNVCTLADTCAGGSCSPGKPQACSDGNPCTDDGCDAQKGCVFIYNTGSCTDNNACTEGDACLDGVCEPGSPKACDDNNGCTTDSCDTKKGCVAVNNTAPCSDANICTDGDSCKDGKCASGGPKVCDDGNVCTTDLCDAAQGCIKVSNAEPCTDDNVCSELDTCSGGKCVPGKPKVCNDLNPCTDDSCDVSKGCVVASNSAPCSDGNACTTSDACSGGTCLGGSALGCDDGNVCTDDSCSKASGCVFAANAGGCSDSNVCTINDFCKSSSCVAGISKSCDDGEICTTDSCDAVADCAHSANTVPCSDGSVCTESDACIGGKCAPGLAKVCNDGNPCTVDACDNLKGCVQPLAANGTKCGDGTCQAGTCTCPAGYSGTGTQCSDINECASNNGGCSSNATCTNTAGSNTCACNSGYSGDGKTCSPSACTVTWSTVDKGSSIVLSNNNKTIASSASWNAARATVGRSTGKWYFEVVATVDANGFDFIGVGGTGATLDGCCTGNTNSWGYYGGPGNLRGQGTNAVAGAASYVSGTYVIGVAVDLDAHTIWWSRNGVWQASGNPATGASPTFKDLSGVLYPMSSVALTGATSTLRACASEFTQAVPSGFLPWN